MAQEKPENPSVQERREGARRGLGKAEGGGPGWGLGGFGRGGVRWEIQLQREMKRERHQREGIWDKKDGSSCCQRGRGHPSATPMVASSPRAASSSAHDPVPTAHRRPHCRPRPPPASRCLGSGGQRSMCGRRNRSGKQYAEKGEEGGRGASLHTPHWISFQTVSPFMCQHPTPTPRFHLMKKPVGWAGVGPGKGPVIQVWGLEGRCERNQLGTPTLSLSSLFGAQKWGWVKCSVLREEVGEKQVKKRLWFP